MTDRLQKIKKQLNSAPTDPGVYLMRDSLGKVIYVGKAKDIKKRVSSYFHPSKQDTFPEIQPKIAALISLVHDLEFITVKTEAEALILESKLIKQWKPRYNTVAKDDKKFYLVKIDLTAKIPQFRLTRNKTDSHSIYFGPFTNSIALRKTLQELRERYGILLGDARPLKLQEGLYKLYDDARADIYHHDNIVNEHDYKLRVLKACAFLEGKAFSWIKEVEDNMKLASSKMEYEKAAQYRDLLAALKSTQEPRRKFQKYLDIPSSEPSTASLKLQEVLALPTPLKIIECFDISHISGEFVVASMVRFVDGKPDKNNYRRYKIKSFIGNDDFRAMEEVVGRRYRRLSSENKPFPDLILIDGGKGQVNAALKSFLLQNLQPPQLIGLAKKKETIIFGDNREDLNLPLNHPALQLLQRVRDEAHRFANAFNSTLRNKKIKESILDNLPGIGPSRKAKLLLHFKNISIMKKASINELSQILGPKLAQELHLYFHSIDSNQQNQNYPSAPSTPPLIPDSSDYHVPPPE